MLISESMRSGVTATHPKRKKTKTAGVGVPVPVQDVAHHANHNLLVELLSISAVISPKPEWVVGIRRGRGSSVPKLVMLPVMAAGHLPIRISQGTRLWGSTTGIDLALHYVYYS